MTRGTAQHNDLGANERTTVERMPEPGPIAVLPSPTAIFTDAVTAGGGEVASLDAATRALVWLSETKADELADVLDSHPQIGWIQLPWAGVDAFAHLIARYPERLWTSAKGAYSEPVAEQALGLTLAMLREYPQKVRAESWVSPKRATSLFGLDVVIVGAGGIAKEIIRLLSVFDVSITVVRRSAAPLDGAHTVTVDQLDAVLPSADVVILAAASTDDTAKLIGAAQLRAMKQTAVLVNIARGALIDTDALVDALRTGDIAGAGLDVTSPEPLPDGHALWSEPRCLITSHSADTPEMTAPLLASRIALNVEAFLSGGAFVGVVDPLAGY